MNLAKIKDLLTPSVSPESKIKAISLFIGRVLDRVDIRLEKLEERQLQRGEKGDKGDRGEIGPSGRDGKDGRDGRDGKTGAKGDKGDTGAVGKSGKTGVSVVDAEIAADDHLVLKLSNGEEIDAGELPVGRTEAGGVFVSGAGLQIVVSSTAPPNPQINDLWYDIS